LANVNGPDTDNLPGRPTQFASQSPQIRKRDIPTQTGTMERRSHLSYLLVALPLHFSFGF